MGFTCPKCSSETNRLVIFETPYRYLGCSNCGVLGRKALNPNLGQTVDLYKRKDGTTGRITTGKAWEIDHRRTTPEGVVINSVTKKEAQY